MPIKFGTDGWRDIIADEFTFDNLRLVARAHAQVLCSGDRPSVVVGFDTRFQGRAFAEVVAEVMGEQGVDVWLSETYLPTPALSYAVVHYGAGGGVMITASHNPPQYSGYKIKGPYGGSATPAIVTQIEEALRSPQQYSGPRGKIRPLDIQQAYYEQLDRQLDLDVLRRYQGRVIHDPMGGAACGWLLGYVQHAGLQLSLEEMHGRPDPLFHGVNPEPVPQNLGELTRCLEEETGLVLGVITDGDADRVGAVTAGGHFFNSHQIFAVLLKHLYQRGLRGRVVKTVSGSRVIELLAEHLGLELLETPVGFKYITDAFLEGQANETKTVLMGGEESGGLSSRGHIPERDGLLNSLLMIEAMAMSGKSLDELFAEIEQQVGFRHFYDRADLHLSSAFDKAALMTAARQQQEVAGRQVADRKTDDGVKLLLEEDASVMFRASGTEPVVRVYVEAQSPDDVTALMEDAVGWVKSFEVN